VFDIVFYCQALCDLFGSVSKGSGQEWLERLAQAADQIEAYAPLPEAFGAILSFLYWVGVHYDGLLSELQIDSHVGTLMVHAAELSTLLPDAECKLLLDSLAQQSSGTDILEKMLRRTSLSDNDK
jgi:hypothetical protein